MSRYMGQRVPRSRDSRFVTGGGRYTDDIQLPGMLHVAFVRSPYAHARILRVDTTEAAAQAGAVLVLTGEQLESLLTPFWSGHETGPFRKAEVWPLARGRVRMVGEPVAAVVTCSRYVAEDIADLIQVEYEPLPVVASAAAALSPDAPRMYEEWPDNIYGDLRFATDGLEQAFEGAATVVSREFSSGRHAAVPIETRGCVADYNPGTGVLTVHMGHQDVHMARQMLSGLLQLPPSQVRVVSPDVGGAFGGKMPVYREEMVVCAASLLLRKPVKWIQDRREGLLADAHARELTLRAELALDGQGRILGLRSHILSDAGAYALAGRGPSPEAVMIANEMPGPYVVPEYGYHAQIVMTNKSPIGICRGVGAPISCFALESLLTIGAAQLGLDPVEIRRRNLVTKFPHRTPTGYVYDTGNYQSLLDRLLAVSDYAAMREQVAVWRSQGRLVGIGLCLMNEGTTRSGVYGHTGLPVSSQEGCHLQMDPVGHVLARFGTTSQGQGLETTLAGVLADQLFIPIEQVRVEMGDTETAPYGGGVWGSRGATAGSAVATMAAQRLREKMATIAAHCLQARPEELSWGDGSIHVQGTDRQMSYAEIARFAYFRTAELPRSLEPGLAVLAHWEPELRATFNAAAHLALVEVDLCTASLKILRWIMVEDCGTILNLGLVDGQLQGGLAQGIGMTAYEQLMYDKAGQLISATFMDYLLPTVHEVPVAEIHHLQTPSAHNPLGSRGVAESATVAAPATLATAVADALGEEICALPITPDHIYRMRAKR